jgi:hypothetical protein
MGDAMATRKAKTKPARKAAAARKPAPKAASKKPAAKAAAPKLPPKWSAAQKSEFAVIQARAKALSAGLKAADFDSEGNPLPGPWASMLGDLHAWARKYNVTLETHEHDHAPAAGGAKAPVGDAPAGATPRAYGGDCPGSFTKTEKKTISGYTYTYNYSCTLRRQTLLGRCVYDCALQYGLAS